MLQKDRKNALVDPTGQNSLQGFGAQDSDIQEVNSKWGSLKARSEFTNPLRSGFAAPESDVQYRGIDSRVVSPKDSALIMRLKNISDKLKLKEAVQSKSIAGAI